MGANTHFAEQDLAQYMTGKLYLERGRRTGSRQDIEKGLEWLWEADDMGSELARGLLDRPNVKKLIAEIWQTHSDKQNEKPHRDWSLPPGIPTVDTP